MSNRSDLFDYVASLSEDAAGAALVKLGAKPAPAVRLYDTPDANGCVQLLHVTNPSWANQRMPVKEVADALPPGSLARATAETALHEAHTTYDIEFHAVRPGPVNECESYIDETTGLPGFREKTSGPNGENVAIPGLCVFPPVVEHGFNLATAQGLTDFLNWIPESSTTKDPGFSPG